MERSLDWEDGEVVAEICSTMSGSVLSVLGAGDVALRLSCLSNIELRLVSDTPSEVALFELKYTAMRQFHPDNVYNLFGVHPAGRRIYVYHQLRPHLSEFTRQWWDQRESVLREGLIHAGQFEQRHKKFRQWAHRLYVNLETKTVGRRTSLLQRVFPWFPLTKLMEVGANSSYVHMLLHEVWSPEKLQNGPASLSKAVMTQVRSGASKWSVENQSIAEALKTQPIPSLEGCYLGALIQVHNVRQILELLKDRLTKGGIVLCWSESCPPKGFFAWERVVQPAHSVHSGYLWKGVLLDSK